MQSDLQVEALLDRYAQAWRLNSAAALVEYWAPDYFAYYKAEEIRTFYTHWDDVLAYWAQNERLHEDIRLRLSAPKHIELSDDCRMAAVDMQWDIRFRSDAALADGTLFHHRGKAMGGANRVLITTKRVEGAWKLVGWSETPDAAITYLTDLYYGRASEDFRA